jgi:hypothetical protein
VRPARTRPAKRVNCVNEDAISEAFSRAARTESAHVEESSAIALRLALCAIASVRIGDALLDGDADPGQGHHQQEITDRDKNGQHRPLPSMQRWLCAPICTLPQAGDADLSAKLRSPCYAATLLDECAPAAIYRVMLQHNSARAGKKAHIAHAALISLHALCCGLPALAMIAAAVSGATSGVAVLAGAFEPFHALLHAHEVWILVVSAALVAIGGAMEALARRGAHNHGFPWLFAFSVVCFLVNVAIIVSHRAL